MSMRPHPAAPPRLVLCPRSPLLYWPVIAAAAFLAMALVGGCLAAAWLLTRPGQDATAVAQAERRPESRHLPRRGEPPPESAKAAAPSATEPPTTAPDRKATETAASSRPPLPVLDSLPGATVGRKRDAARKEVVVGDPGLARIDDAVQAEQPTGSFGTQITFVDSPSDAAQQALKEHKLVFVLHVSGNFEDAKFT